MSRVTTPLQDGLNASQALKRDSILSKEHLRRALSSIEKDSFRYQNDVAKRPWLEETTTWSKQRIRLAQIVRSQSFETVMGFVIILNLVLMVIETNADASCYPDFAGNTRNCPSRSSSIEWLQSSNVVLLVIYTLECLCRAFVERSSYVCNSWNLIDLFTVVAGWSSIALASFGELSVLRILRVARLVRLGRLMISVPELYVLVSGLSSSFKAILFGSVLLVAVILVWSIIVVEFLHPVNVEIAYIDCERCPRGFQTVFAASLTLFSQIVAGDQWSSISVPLAEQSPWTAPIMFFMMTTISLGVMNLILAVIVEKAAEARANNKEQKRLAKENEREARMVELAILCDSMDRDKDGNLTLEEMLEAFDHNEKFFNLMQHMDISRAEVEVVHNVLSGEQTEVDYMEFCHQLSSVNKRDPLMIQSLMKFSVMELRRMLKTEVMEALQKQNEILEDHLKLLAHVPSCAEAAKDLEKKRSSPPPKGPASLQPVKTQAPQLAARPSLAPAESEEAIAAAPSLPTLNLDTVGESLEAACVSFQQMEAELKDLVRKAEMIPKSCLREASPMTLDIYRVKSGSSPSVPHLNRGHRSASSLGISSATGSLDSENAGRFQDMVSDFQQSMQRHREREEQLQLCSREAVNAVRDLMKEWLVKEEL